MNNKLSIQMIGKKWRPFLQSALEAADLGRDLLLSYFGHLSKVAEKKQAGLVSEADKLSERLIAEHLLGKHPDSRFLGEETGWSHGKGHHRTDDSNDLVWIVDPLDGTNNYVHQLPIYCISIGLKAGRDMVVSVVDVPALNYRYHAVKGCGAFCNGEKIHVSHRKKVSKMMLATGFSPDRSAKSLEYHLSMMRKTLKHSRCIRRVGTAAFDLCMVAQGTFDGYWEHDLKPWDTAAGALLVSEAGGTVTDFYNSPYDSSSHCIVAASKPAHKFLMRSLLATKFPF